MNETRQSMVTVPLDLILFGDGTALDDDGNYTFGWDKFDKFVETFVERGSGSSGLGSTGGPFRLWARPSARPLG
ncbi:hypothetical protein M3650_11875 [Paenibacillus sp. MER TA 81-3]|nr:hypothetical protein [Paenibacillus sp. MER TA 81-3]MCM3339316.1 hypothetical protein [Paenibacillus sp. MER TA 81-3]